MIRKHLRFAGLAVVVAGMTACGGGDDTTPAVEQPQEQPPTTSPAPSPTTGGDAAAPGNLPQGVTAAQFQQGKQIFESNGLCFTCHAIDGSGSALGPSLRDGEWLWVNASAPDLTGQIANIVRQGVPQPKEYPAPMLPMGGAQLSDDQIQAVSAYVHAISQGA